MSTDAATSAVMNSRDGQSGRTSGARKGLGEIGAAYILIAPMLLLFAIASIYPLFETFRLAFFDIRGLGTARFVGIDNYLKLFLDANFQRALLTTLVWTIGTTAISVGLGFALAIMCSMAPRETLVFRVIFFMAYAISETVSGFIWLGIFRSGEEGMLNALLGAIGLSGFTHSWLGGENTAIWAVIIAYAWTQVGLPLMLCFAAVQSIPTSIREAAYLDGASNFTMMRRIILPLSMPGLRVSVFINVLASLRAFDMIFVMTGGGPVRSTETVGFFMYREAVTQFELGYGAAATVLLLAMVLLVSIPAILERTKSTR